MQGVSYIGGKPDVCIFSMLTLGRNAHGGHTTISHAVRRKAYSVLGNFYFAVKYERIKQKSPTIER